MAWYKAGSIAISGTTVTGTGTNWSDNKMGIGPGQALLVPAAGTVRMFEILRVDSATRLTLTSDAGTVPAGQAYAVMSFYTDSVPDFARRLSAQLSYYQSQMDGWQQIMTGSGSITLTDPNGMQVTISSFKKLTDDMDAKVDKSSLAFGTTVGTYCQGNDVRLNTMNGKTGGSTTGGIINESKGMTLRSSDASQGWFYALDFQAGQGNNITFARIYQSNSGINLNVGVNGTPKFNTFDASGNYFCQGNITCVALTQTSDADKKDKIEKITSALDKVSELDGVTYVLNDTGMPSAGVLADALLKVLPECVGSVFDDHDIYEDVEEKNGDGETVTVRRLIHKRDDSKRSYTVEYSGVIALCVEAIKELKAKVDRLDARPGS